MSSPPDPFSFAPSIRLAVGSAQRGLALAAWQGQREQLTQMRIAVAEAIAKASSEDAARLYEQWLAEERQIALAASARLDDENKRMAANALQANEPLITAWRQYPGDLPFGVATSLSAPTTQRRQQQQQQRRQRTPAPPEPSARQWQPLPVLTGPTATAPPAPPSGAAAAAAASGGAAASSSSSSSSSGSGGGFQFVNVPPASSALSFSAGGGAPPTEPPRTGVAKRGDPERTSPERKRKGALVPLTPDEVAATAERELREGETDDSNLANFYDNFDEWAETSQTAKGSKNRWPTTLEQRREFLAAAEQAFAAARLRRVQAMQTDTDEPVRAAQPQGVAIAGGEFVFDDDEPPR